MDEMSIKKVNVAKLTNEELLQYASDIIGVVKKSNVSDLGLTGVYNLCEAAVTEANSYSKENRKHPRSAEIEAARKERDNKVTSVTTLTRGYKQAPAATVKAAVEKAAPVLEVHLNGFVKVNNFVKSQRLKMLFAAIEADAELVAALQTIGLGVFIDEIKAIDEQLKAMVDERRATQPEKQNEHALVVFDKMSKLIRRLLSTIDTNALVETTKDFRPLISELNAVNAEYSRTVSIRMAKRKAEDAKKATAPAAATTGTVNKEVA